MIFKAGFNFKKNAIASQFWLKADWLWFQLAATVAGISAQNFFNSLSSALVWLQLVE